MRSMTGYGYFFYKDEKYDIEVEIKSVNSRGLDMNINTDSSISHLDSFIRDKVTTVIKRGRVYVKVYVTDKTEQNLDLNPVYLQRLIDIHKEAQSITGIEDKISLQRLLESDGVLIRKVSKINDESFTEKLSLAFDNSLAVYDKMARAEGSKMKSCISTSIQDIKEAANNIEAYIPEYRETVRDKLVKSLQEYLTEPLGEDIDKKLLAEISFYLDRHDVTEEIVRFKDHLEKIDHLLADDRQETGRKLNFIFQELHREIQTTGAKLSGVKVFPSILIIKEEIEKCRELVQNVE